MLRASRSKSKEKTADRALQVLLAECNIRIQEIENHGGHENRTFGILFAAVGASLAIVVVLQTKVFTPLPAGLESVPSLLLVAGILTTWFPLNAVQQWLEVKILVAYITRKLLPRIEAIASSEPTDQPRDYLVGWEWFRDNRFTSSRRQNFGLWPVPVFREFVLYIPSILLLVNYLVSFGATRGNRSHYSAVEIVLAAIIAAADLAAFCTGMYLQFARRFRLDKTGNYEED